jgi:hypothetical protein
MDKVAAFAEAEGVVHIAAAFAGYGHEKIKGAVHINASRIAIGYLCSSCEKG